MITYPKYLNFRGKNILIISIFAGVLIWVLAIFLGLEIKRVEADSFLVLVPILTENKELATIQENSILPISNPNQPVKPSQNIKMIVTAYSSTLWETDNDPYITASGSGVKEGIVANNMLPFGTEIKIPELYGDKVFVVEDRMNWRKSNYHIDIWFPNYSEALNFGAKITYIEVSEN